MPLSKRPGSVPELKIRLSETTTIAAVLVVMLEGQSPWIVLVVEKLIVNVPVPSGLTVYEPVSDPAHTLVPSLTVSVPPVTLPFPSVSSVPTASTVPCIEVA